MYHASQCQHFVVLQVSCVAVGKQNDIISTSQDGYAFHFTHNTTPLLRFQTNLLAIILANHELEEAHHTLFRHRAPVTNFDQSSPVPVRKEHLV